MSKHKRQFLIFKVKMTMRGLALLFLIQCMQCVAFVFHASSPTRRHHMRPLSMGFRSTLKSRVKRCFKPIVYPLRHALVG